MTERSTTKHLTITELLAWPKARNKGSEVDRRAAKGKPGTAFQRVDDEDVP